MNLPASSLQASSPALYFSLCRVFKKDPEALQEICLGWSELVSPMHFELASIVRSPDQTFNPRPARIAQLVLGEIPAKESLRAAIALSVLTAASTEILGGSNVQSYGEKTYFLADTYKQMISDGSYSGRSLESLEEILLLALFLDELRHLHMSSYSKEERSKRALAVQRVLPLLSITSRSRLRSLTNHAVAKILS